MRETKYRAWDKKTKCIFNLYDICFLNGGIRVSGTGVYFGNGWVTEENGFKHECDIILMQYAGLKDKNRKEIYECDVVKVFTKSDYLDKEDWKTFKGEIRFHKGQWVIWDNKTTIPLYGFEDIEVLGHIYENL